MFLGIDIGSTSAKAALVDRDGRLVRFASRPGKMRSPRTGFFEHDAEADWWKIACALCADISRTEDLSTVLAVGFSGVGPCVLLTDDSGAPMYDAVLYGIDTRAATEVRSLTETIGAARLLEIGGNELSSQSVLPKILWLYGNIEATSRARRWFTSQSYLLWKATGAYCIDHYTASHSHPLYDLRRRRWWDDVWESFVPNLRQPSLEFAGVIAGNLTESGSSDLGLPLGLPVVTGTADSYAEGLSVGMESPGDLMLQYGSTLFLIAQLSSAIAVPGLWAGASHRAGQATLAAGSATSGLLFDWCARLTNRSVDDLMVGAAEIPAATFGLLALPYFSGERSPIQDPGARGIIMGLDLRHGPSHIFRALLESTALGVRHDLDVMRGAGLSPGQIFAVGGGVAGGVWPQIMSDVTGIAQSRASITVGASYGGARLAARALGLNDAAWNPPAAEYNPNANFSEQYAELYSIFRALYPATSQLIHRLGTLSTEKH